ncbi:MAG TPA: class I SAM-dependent methyltransferase [Ktedonosporobacter sp.]|nr:class I SAM-dependent methyltransferase [Ktedonosporobacter sp.]
MSDLTNPPREHPSTYFVLNRSNEDELTRLRLQDQMLTAGMGGVLPEQPDPSIFRRVLDVGCGTGGWIIQTAKTYPDIQLLIGVDVSKRMMDYAREQAAAQGVSDRVEFHVMDSLRMLEFSTGFFNLVNQRCGASYLRTWDWPKLLSEFQRVCKPGGVIRITEFDIISESSSPAHLRLSELGRDVLYRAGHLFTPDPEGVTSQLAHLLYRYAWVLDAQTRAYKLHYSAGTPEGQLFYEDMKHLYQTVLPFLRKWTRIPDDYQTIYQQMLTEMQQPDFTATFPLLTAWGHR